MKKTYIQPSMEMDIISSGMTQENMGWTALCGSVTSPDMGIGYGDVDEAGELDPASRRAVWDEEE